MIPTRQQLLDWAKTSEARPLFPVLVRKLIRETSNGLHELDMPGEEGTALHGVDGVVMTSAPSLFVPEGKSVWEVSVSKKSAKKPADDIGKRDEAPDGSPAAECTYVAVLLAPWERRREWARSERQRGHWRDVRAIGVDAIVDWLDTAPATAAWLLERLGFPTKGVTTAERWWRMWSRATEPELSADLVLAGRVNESALCATRMRAPGICSIGGELGTQEIVACIVASAIGSDSLAGRMMIVDDRHAWRWLLTQTAPLILVTSDPSFLEDVDAETPHAVLAPIAHGTGCDIRFPSAETERVVDLLRTSGVSPDVTYQLGYLARRSFVAFRRRIAKRRELMQPTWAAGSPSRAMRAALLLVSWNERHDADRELVERLTGTSYALASEAFLELSTGEDPFLVGRDGRFNVVSPPDAWALLGRHVTRDDLRAFVPEAVDALLAPQPERSPWSWRDPDQRSVGPSTEVRRGLAASLALLGTYGEELVIAGGLHGEEWVNRAVYDLCRKANEDRTGQVWTTLAPSLPDLAEAAPRVFLEGVAKGLEGEDPVLIKLFDEDADDVLGSQSSHTGLLWALEATSWAAEYFTRSAQLLSRLAQVDPGGRLANRPRATLSSVFCPWRPETAASSEHRIATLDALRRSSPAASWDLMVDLLPKPHDTHFPTRAPKYRPWRPDREAVLRSEYLQFVDGLVDRLLADCGNEADRWTELFSAYAHLPPTQRKTIRDALSGLTSAALQETEREILWEKLRATVAFNREYADANWALSATELADLEFEAERFAPESSLKRHRWLFHDNWAYLGDVKKRDNYQAYETAREERRAHAVAEIHAERDLPGVLEFADAVPEKRAVGAALATSGRDCHIDDVLDWLDSEDEVRRQVGEGYISRMVRSHGDAWGWTLIETRPGLSPAAQSVILLCCVDVLEAAKRADGLGPAPSAEFWRRFSYFGLGGDFPGVLYVSEKLRSVGRWAASLDLLALYARVGATTAEYAEAVAAGFEGLMQVDPSQQPPRELASHDFEVLFKVLDKHVGELGLDRVTTIEWCFFPVLGFEPGTTMLHRRLAADPRFFVEVVSIVYLAEEEERPTGNVDENLVRRAQNAWTLLASWHFPPGSQEDETFDVNACRSWIRESAAILEEAGRLSVGMQCVGEVLAHSPRDPEGTWPDEQLRDLIEEVGNNDLLRGIERALFNRRGVHGRGIFDGGDQERKLAEQYRVQETQFRDRWPKLAVVFEGLAATYEADARREDERAERRQRGLDF